MPLLGAPLFVSRYLIPSEQVESVWLQEEPPWGDGYTSRINPWHMMVAIGVAGGFTCYLKLMNDTDQTEILSLLRAMARVA